MKRLGYSELFSRLSSTPRGEAWSQALRASVDEAFIHGHNGNLPRWLEALDKLPDIAGIPVLGPEAVGCSGFIDEPGRVALRAALEGLRPWRKGPFQLFDIFLDTEWRSHLKWSRLSSRIDLEGQDVLDVGCGNGYYGWRMLEAGARSVVGLDPNLLFVMQHAAIRRYLGPLPNYVLPAGDTMIPTNLRLFHTVFSMGVLYHRKSPIEHLLLLGQALKPGGRLVMETLVIDGDGQSVLVPEERYAQMNNVWFLPTCDLLERMMARCGFRDIEVVDVTRTTVEEQRPTPWMTFESLPNFLHPENPNLTIEGYQAPTRAIVLARK